MTEMTIQKIKDEIRAIPDFPKPGILFRDITTALRNAETLKLMIDHLYEQFKDEKIDYVAGIESRGFIVGTPLAYKLNAGFIPIRKPNKLPSKKFVQKYQLEYGEDSIEMHQDAISPNAKVLIVDDLLATGGTACAAIDLIHQAEGEVVATAFWIELSGLNGRKRIEDMDCKVVSMLEY